MAKHIMKKKYTTLEAVLEITRSSDEEDVLETENVGSEASSISSDEERAFLEGRDPALE